ncbi:hypothetical protein WA026_017602 [Henosepilachna vigintioctopunctata]|uniref:Reverse transcriptase domain-containing protein n=1 Tax=Henosepilachna vigintioctopunctata TaxID=420089 RepID=A0AAW1V322_9CUCU
MLNESLQFKVPGYQIIRNDRSRHGGGIATLIKNNLKFVELNFPFFEIPQNLQIHAIKIDDLSLVHVYCPPNENLSENLLNELFLNLTSPFIICGDMNGQNPIWGSGIKNRNGQNIENFLLNNDCVIINDKSPTRITPPNTNKSAPDVTISSPEIALMLEWSVLLDPGNSDHFPIEIRYNNISSFSEHPANRNPLKRYNLKSANWESFNTAIIEIMDTNEPESIKTFQEMIIKATNGTIKEKQNNKDKNKFKLFWWDDNLQEDIKKRQLAFRKYLDFPSLENYILAKQYQAIAKRNIRCKKKEAFSQFCSNLNHKSSGEMWRDVKKFKSGCNVPLITKATKSCGEEILNDLCPPIIPAEDCLTIVENPTQFPDIMLNELLLTIQSKNKDTSPGLDGISYSMIKHLPLRAKIKLLQLFNNLLNYGQIPPELKTTIIIPICKPGKSPDLSSSYRPIALSSCIIKILETIIASRLEIIYEKKFSNNDLQFGFRKGKSTFDAIAYLTSSIYISFARKEAIIVVFLDIKSAYDNVNPYNLIKILMNDEIPNELINILKSLLLERNLMVLDPYLHELIGPKQTNKGLPQGSPLSPILFNLFVKDIAQKIESRGIKIIKYADDTAIISTASNFQTALTNMKNTLLKTEDYFRSKNLELSPGKSAAIHFHPTKKWINLPQLQIYESNIPWLEQVKYLGVIFQKNLKWNAQIHNMSNKAIQGLNIIKSLSRTWWGAHPKTLLLIYKSMVRSHLDYGSIFIGKCPKTLLYKLDKVQYAAIRSALGLMKSTPVNILLTESGELPLKHRRSFLALKFISKSVCFNNNPIINKIRSLSYWKQLIFNNNSPAIIDCWEKFDILDKIKRDNHLPCFTFSLPIIYSTISYNDSKLEKTCPNNSIPFNSIISKKYPNYHLIFTDASKINQSTGIGIYSYLEISHSERIPNYFSICSAELIAIQRAIELIASKKLLNSLIISDSKSALEKYVVKIRKYTMRN